MKKSLTNIKYFIFMLIVCIGFSSHLDKVYAGEAAIDIVFTVNAPPVATAGVDRTINLPLTSVTIPTAPPVGGSAASDPDDAGMIAIIAWTKVSGGTATITNGSTLSPTFSNLTLVGSPYTFRLTVTDNNNATDTDDMIVTVKAAINNPQCSDSTDNDTDTKIDTADPGCHTDGNPANAGTYVAADDDETDGPPQPTNVRAVAGACSTGTINLSWNASAGATAYNIRRKENAGSYFDVGGTSGTSFADSNGLVAGRTYTYIIQAQNAASYTTDSNPASAVAPAASCPIAGVCGATPLTCDLGTVSNQQSTRPTYTWSCTVDTSTQCSKAYPQCDDTLDNDGDLLIDFGPDPGCISTGDDSEKNIKINVIEQ